MKKEVHLLDVMMPWPAWTLRFRLFFFPWRKGCGGCGHLFACVRVLTALPGRCWIRAWQWNPYSSTSPSTPRLLVMLRSLVPQTPIHIGATACIGTQLQYPAYEREIFFWRLQSLRNLNLSGKLFVFCFSLNQSAIRGMAVKNHQIKIVVN